MIVLCVSIYTSDKVYYSNLLAFEQTSTILVKKNKNTSRLLPITTPYLIVLGIRIFQTNGPCMVNNSEQLVI